MNKKQLAMLDNYERATETSVLTAYGRCSNAKIRAEREIIEEMNDRTAMNTKSALLKRRMR